MWNMIVEMWKDYAGTGMILGLFLVAVIYLLLTEKRKDIKILFVYVPILVIFLFLCPIMAKIIYNFAGDEIYYRILWLLPMVPAISYSAVKVIHSQKGRTRYYAASGLAIIIILSGDYVYDNIYYSKAENSYHVPRTVVEICDAIVVEGREVMAVFPVEMLQYVRQYAPTVCMPYGRELTVERWQNVNILYDAIAAEPAEAGMISERAKGFGCHFVIFSGDKAIAGNLEDYGYRVFKEVGGYIVYEDTTVYRGLWGLEK